LLSITEFIAYQLPEVQEALVHPTMGIATKCKFPPNVAELREFIEDRAKRLYPPPRAYPLFKRDGVDPEVDPRPAPDRRKAQVLAELGYDPSKPQATKRAPIEPAIRDAMEEGSWSSAHLKTPSRPASPELKALLIEQGYLLPRKDAAA
jgi:hypothetical protein